jgi:hypothetical protein
MTMKYRMQQGKYLFRSGVSPPDHGHDDDDRSKLQDYPQTHQFLRPVGTTAPQHVEQAEKQNDGNRTNSDRNKNTLKRHDRLLIPKIHTCKTRQQPKEAFPSLRVQLRRSSRSK